MRCEVALAYLVADRDNPADTDALLIIDVKIHPLGFVPRYYTSQLSTLYHGPATSSSITTPSARATDQTNNRVVC